MPGEHRPDYLAEWALGAEPSSWNSGLFRRGSVVQKRQFAGASAPALADDPISIRSKIIAVSAHAFAQRRQALPSAPPAYAVVYATIW